MEVNGPTGVAPPAYENNRTNSHIIDDNNS